MPEYIERQAALDALQAPEMFGITPYHIELINRIPAADVAPVAHGEWIVCGDGTDVPFIIHVFIPSRETLIEMQIARFTTVENAEWALDAVKSATDYIVSAIKELQ